MKTVREFERTWYCRLQRAEMSHAQIDAAKKSNCDTRPNTTISVEKQLGCRGIQIVRTIQKFKRRVVTPDFDNGSLELNIGYCPGYFDSCSDNVQSLFFPSPLKCAAPS
jgi:hypothetical protein